MNNQNLLPDFGAIAKTDWGKPAVNTKDTLSLVAVIASAVMLITLFLPWFGISEEGLSMTKMGLATWTGIFALIGTLAALVGSLYNHKGLAFCGAALSALFALISLFCVFSLSMSVMGISREVPVEDVKRALQHGGVSAVRWGAIFHLIAAAATAVVTYLGINKK